jgi:hypothetical protein
MPAPVAVDPLEEDDELLLDELLLLDEELLLDDELLDAVPLEEAPLDEALALLEDVLAALPLEAVELDEEAAPEDDAALEDVDDAVLAPLPEPEVAAALDALLAAVELALVDAAAVDAVVPDELPTGAGMHVSALAHGCSESQPSPN